jgi:ABC-type transporter Mla subunit MlaD
MFNFVIILVCIVYATASAYLAIWRLEAALGSAGVECRACLKDARLGRDDLLAHLDDVFASNGVYLWLNRMTMMAPLLGVVLTAIGFISLAASMRGARLTSVESYLGQLHPLFYGVVSGALLAIYNQVMVQYAGHRLRKARQEARLELFRAIPVADERRSIEKRLARVNDVLNTFAGRLTGLGVAIDSAASSATQEIGGKAVALSQALGDLADSLREGRERVGRAVDQFAEQAGTAGAAVCRSLAGTETAINDFATRTRGHFDRWQTTLDQSGSALEKSITGLATTAGRLTEVVGTLSERCVDMGEAVRTSRASAEDMMKAATQTLAYVAKVEAGLDSSIQSVVKGLDRASQRCEQAVSSLDAAATNLGTGCGSLQAAAATLNTSSGTLEASSKVLQDGVATLDKGFGDVRSGADGFSTELQALMSEFSGQLRTLKHSTERAGAAAVSLDKALTPIAKQSQSVLSDTRDVVGQWRTVVEQHGSVVREMSKSARARREADGHQRPWWRNWFTL